MADSVWFPFSSRSEIDEHWTMYSLSDKSLTYIIDLLFRDFIMTQYVPIVLLYKIYIHRISNVQSLGVDALCHRLHNLLFYICQNHTQSFEIPPLYNGTTLQSHQMLSNSPYSLHQYKSNTH